MPTSNLSKLEKHALLVTRQLLQCYLLLNAADYVKDHLYRFRMDHRLYIWIEPCADFIDLIRAKIVCERFVSVLFIFSIVVV